jgi:hypothetical protein
MHGTRSCLSRSGIVREAAGFGDRSGGRARIDLFDDEDMARFLLHPAWREESSLADARRRILKEDDDLPNGLAEIPVDEPGFVARARALRDAGLLKAPLYCVLATAIRDRPVSGVIG